MRTMTVLHVYHKYLVLVQFTLLLHCHTGNAYHMGNGVLIEKCDIRVQMDIFKMFLYC